MTAETLERHPEAEEIGRTKRLKAATNTTHDRLDKTIMAADPFGSRDRYALFLKVQHDFHRVVDVFYTRYDMWKLIPDLAERRRLDLIRQDIADLGGKPPALRSPDYYLIDAPTVLGWLYVAEGSNLGATFLLKEAAKLGLSETFGARHLAAAPEGRGKHWKTFTAALDAIELKSEEEERVIEGARQAFTRVHGLVKEVFG